MIATNQFGTFFGISQQVLDAVWEQLTAPEGNSVAYISMEIGADRDVFHPIKSMLERQEITVDSNPELARYIELFPSRRRNWGFWPATP